MSEEEAVGVLLGLILQAVGGNFYMAKCVAWRLWNVAVMLGKEQCLGELVEAYDVWNEGQEVVGEYTD